MSGCAAKKRPISGGSQRAANDGATLTRRRSGFVQSLLFAQIVLPPATEQAAVTVTMAGPPPQIH